jgi:hypothetical protein
VRVAFQVHVVVGPYHTSQQRVKIEGILVSNTSTTDEVHWIDTMIISDVEDGRVTIDMCLVKTNHLVSVEVFPVHDARKRGMTHFSINLFWSFKN